MLKLVIFDLDGLLLDTEKIYYRAFCETCDQYGLADSYHVYYQTVGADDDHEKEIYRASFPGLDFARFHADIQRKCFRLILSERVPIKSGLIELLDFLDGYPDLKKGVATCNYRISGTALLRQAGIYKRFDGFIFRDMVANGKPEPDLYLECCRQFSVRPEEALVLEDSKNGILAALAAQIPTIAIPDLVMPSPDVLASCVGCFSSLDAAIPYFAHRLSSAV